MNDVLDVDEDLLELFESVFADARESSLTGLGDAEIDRATWQRLSALGLTRLTGREDRGGSGAGWTESASLLAAAVRHGVRLPLGEHDLLAGWLREELGLADVDGISTACILDRRGSAVRVPWTSVADSIVALWPQGDGSFRGAEIATSHVALSRGTNTIGEPRDSVLVDLSRFKGMYLGPDLVEIFRLKCALIRAVQVCAALERALELSVEHATSREQFGRSISANQAVQRLLAETACEAALARAATEAALREAVVSEWGSPELAFDVAVARSCVGHAVTTVVRNAHQVLGAIGTTLEHDLHRYTRAALAWRSDYGSVQFWDQHVANSALVRGRNDTWPLVAR